MSRGLSLLLGLGLALVPAVAAPHAVLVKASPAARARLTQSPPRVELWFNERLEPAYSTGSVWNRDGAQVDLRDARVPPDDPKRLVLGVVPLPPGEYTVRYRVLSVDGHLVEASHTFMVVPAARGR